MATIQVAKILTTLVAGGALPVYGFTISSHSETEEYLFDDSATIDTATLSVEDQAVVTAFIAIMNAQMAL